MRLRKAFSMIELVFVIVIIGILSKFGVEFLAQAYNSYIFTNINNKLQSNSASAVEFISTRLQHRIKDSIIARDATTNNFESLSSASGTNFTILEWIGADVDGFRGNQLPNWSGVIDLDLSSGALLSSPGTSTTNTSNLINILSDGDSSISDAALFFIGSNTDRDGYGWNGVAFADQSQVMHPIDSNGVLTQFIPDIGNFFGATVSEYYKLAWSAYAVVPDANGDLWLYYDYQPWEGETYLSTNAKSALIMQDVNTFRFMAIGSLVKIQVCVKSDLITTEDERYSICKEKTIY